MTDELKDLPGVIIQGDKITRTTKVKKWISKNNPTNYKVEYLDPIPGNFRLIERELKNLENKIKGVEVKERVVDTHPYIKESPYVLRVRVNEIMTANTKKEFEGLLQSQFNDIKYRLEKWWEAVAEHDMQDEQFTLDALDYLNSYSIRN